jgi:Flp pilus assembly protein TadG
VVTRPAAGRAAARRALRRWHADERGAAVVEFAMVVPVLLVLVTAIIDFSRMLAVAASLAAAVRDGARQAAASGDIVNDASQLAAVQRHVAGAFQPYGGTPIAAGDVQVSRPDAAGNVSVTVAAYAYRPITPVARLVGLGTITFTRTSTFRWERAQ